MPLDTRIALGAQPLQLENQLAQYGQAVGIQNAMQQNQLGQMQMSAAQRTMQEEEGAKSFLSTNPDLSNVENQRRLLAFGKTGLAYGKAFLDQRKASQDSDKTAAEILGLNQKNFTAFNSPMRAAANGIPGITAYVEAMYAHPVLGALARKIKTKEQALQENIAIFTKDPDQWVTAHASLEGSQLLDALKRNAEKVAEDARIASLPPLPGAVPTGTVNDTRAALAVPGAQSMEARPVAAAGGLTPVALNAMATPAAAPVNALADNEATLQAISVESKQLTDRLAVLERMRPSPGRDDEIKRREARLKELNAPINLRADGTSIIPGKGTLTAAAALSDIQRLQREEATLRAAGNTKEADVIADQIKVKNQLRDDRAEMEKLVDAEIAARKNGQLRKAADLAEQIAVKNQSIDITTMKALGYPITKEGFKAFKEAQRQEKSKSEFEQLLEDAGMTDDQKKAARAARVKKETTFAPGTTVNVNAGSKAEEVEFGKYVVDQYKDVSARADIATRSLPALDTNLKILEKGFDTGFGTETIAAGAKVLAALGVQNAKDFATDSQTFLANANSAVLQKQLEQKGTQTATDAARIESTGAQLGNTKEANKFILSVAKAQLQRDIAQRKFYSAWRTEKETFKGAEDAWYAGPGGASLFDSPILKKYAEPSGADLIPGSKPTTTGGNVVTLPDGRTKTFPTAEAANQFKKAAGL